MLYNVMYIIGKNVLYNKKRSSQTPRPGFSLFECYKQKLSVLVFLMGQDPKCPGYN